MSSKITFDRIALLCGILVTMVTGAFLICLFEQKPEVVTEIPTESSVTDDMTSAETEPETELETKAENLYPSNWFPCDGYNKNTTEYRYLNELQIEFHESRYYAGYRILSDGRYNYYITFEYFSTYDVNLEEYVNSIDWDDFQEYELYPRVIFTENQDPEIYLPTMESQPGVKQRFLVEIYFEGNLISSEVYQNYSYTD